MVISQRVRSILIYVVTSIWALNFIAGLVSHTYHPSESINGIFMAVVGGVFVVGARRSSDDDDKDEK